MAEKVKDAQGRCLKLWYQSKTLWVQIVSAVGHAAGLAAPLLIKLELPPEQYLLYFVGVGFVQASATGIVRYLEKEPSVIVSRKTRDAIKAGQVP